MFKQKKALTLGDPRFWWTYGDEDLQRIMKQIAVRCHPSNLATTVLFRWLCGRFR